MIKWAILLYCPFKQTVHLSCPALRFCFVFGIAVAPHGCSLSTVSFYNISTPIYYSNFFCILAVHFFFFIFSKQFLITLFLCIILVRSYSIFFYETSKSDQPIHEYAVPVCMNPKTYTFTGIYIYLCSCTVRHGYRSLYFPINTFFLLMYGVHCGVF